MYIFTQLQQNCVSEPQIANICHYKNKPRTLYMSNNQIPEYYNDYRDKLLSECMQSSQTLLIHFRTQIQPRNGGILFTMDGAIWGPALYISKRAHKVWCGLNPVTFFGDFIDDHVKSCILVSVTQLFLYSSGSQSLHASKQI